MKIKVNRNILWTETFVRELSAHGVKYACISPGSRNTPLTLAFANNKKIKSFVHIDERSCGFFALGLAKVTSTPVAIVCTSGTATAELYPAIIEAYQSRVPLIVCTADRPPEMRGLGANQTINQHNLYSNHIRWFFDAGLPGISESKLKKIQAAAAKAYHIAAVLSKGPVHLNFPFRKPFEPLSYTDIVDNSLLKLKPVDKSVMLHQNSGIFSAKWFNKLYSKITKSTRGLIIAGPECYAGNFAEAVQQLSFLTGFPILADGASQLRFGVHCKKNIITNYEGFLRTKKFTAYHKPDLILQFGRTITSKALDEYLETHDCERYLINEYGDWFDPSDKASASYACDPGLFCGQVIIKLQKEKNYRINENWLKDFTRADEISGAVKKSIISTASFPAESRIINEILDAIPHDTNIMISNSMPIRDFDYFASTSSKNITIFQSRGASGIDGIISTALGIAAESGKTTVLITGDLAFYYDLNGLLAASKYNIPLIVILINNNGGGIFEVLPIAGYRNFFNDYFLTPHNLKFSVFVKGYNGNHENIKGWKQLHSSFVEVLKDKKLSVLEIQTNAVKSLELRRKFWAEVDKNLG